MRLYLTESTSSRQTLQRAVKVQLPYSSATAKTSRFAAAALKPAPVPTAYNQRRLPPSIQFPRAMPTYTPRDNALASPARTPTSTKTVTTTARAVVGQLQPHQS